MKTPDFKAKDTVFLTISERTYWSDHFDLWLFDHFHSIYNTNNAWSIYIFYT